MTKSNYVDFSSGGGGVPLNPADGLCADDLTTLLRTMTSAGLSVEDQNELEDQLEALVPALIELRDAGHMALNMRVIADSAKLEGFMRLAEDDRLSPLSRQRCRAIRDRIIVQGVKALLGHL